jgi:deazaflavin-dependent oxidoreductase (nitroreductase family)
MEYPAAARQTMNPLMKLFVAGNVALFRSTNGRMGSTMGGNSLLLLTTKGAKSGKPRTVPVMFFEDGGHRFVVASFGGSPKHPAWFKNLERDPKVTVEVKGKRYDARAEVMGPEDRARCWQKVTTTMPQFAEYEKKTQGRVIPLVYLKESS